MRFALDQNFPLPVLRALTEFFPPRIRLEHINRIDERLSRLDDDELVLELGKREFDGFVTTDHRMLDDPATMAALISTKLVAVVIEAAGHNVLKATGAMLLELPGLPDRVGSKQAMILRIPKFRARPAEPAWAYLEAIALRHGTTANALWAAHRPT